MKQLIINEKKYMNNLLETHIKDDNMSMSQLIYLLAKYFYTNKKWYDKQGNELSKPVITKITTDKKTGNSQEVQDPVKIKKLVDELVKNVDQEMEKFKISTYYFFRLKKQIEKTCRIVVRYNKKLREEDTIPLLSDELEVIKKCDTDRERKVMFVCYIYARFLDKNGFIDGKFTNKSLFKLANVTGTKDKLNEVIYDLIQKEFLFQNDINDNIDLWVKPGTGEVVLEVDSFSNLGNYIISVVKDDYKICVECGKPFKIKSKNDFSSKYCNKCAHKIKNEQNLEWVHRKNQLGKASP